MSKVKDRDKVVELILEMGADGKEINIEELAQKDIIDISQTQQKSAQVVLYQRLRSLVRRVFEGEGKTVHSIRKNVYKVVQQDNADDCQAVLNRLVKRHEKIEQKIMDLQQMMIEKGHPVQDSLFQLTAKRSAEQLENKRPNTIVPVKHTSAKSKKAVNA